jgi:hypothetical protein
MVELNKKNKTTKPEWCRSIMKEEYSKTKELKTICIHSLKGIPEVFILDFPEMLYEGYFEKFPDTAIMLCSVW